MKKPSATPTNISARLSQSGFDQFKKTMGHLKTKFGPAITVADLLEMVTSLPMEELESKVTSFIEKKNTKKSIADKMANISEEARARIEAILAEEVEGKA